MTNRLLQLKAYGQSIWYDTIDRAQLLSGLFERLIDEVCGLPRSHDLPVPYEQANIPQAWAAAVPILAAQLFLGLLPDVPHGRCFVSPWLPEWLSHLELRGIAMGQGSLDIMVPRRGTDTVIEQVDGKHIEVIEGTVEAPLWWSMSRNTKAS